MIDIYYLLSLVFSQSKMTLRLPYLKLKDWSSVQRSTYSTGARIRSRLKRSFMPV